MSMSDSSPVTYSQRGAVVTLRLERPETRNSLTHELRVHLLAALQRADADADVRVVILTAMGKAFSVGQDIEELADLYKDGQNRLGQMVEQEYVPIVQALRSMTKPTISLFTAPAVGGGMALVLATDFRVVTQQAVLIPAFVQVGLAPDSGVSFFLSRMIGYAKALQVLFTGQRISAEEMVHLGLAETVWNTEEQAVDACQSLASRLAAGPTRAFAAIRQLLDDAAGHSLEETMALETGVQDRLASTWDHKEAIQAFLEKRKPQFRGK